MDFEEIHRKYGDKISFHGTIGTQTVMPFGTPQEVKEAVWKTWTLRGKGRSHGDPDAYAGAGGTAGKYPGLCGSLQNL